VKRRADFARREECFRKTICYLLALFSLTIGFSQVPGSGAARQPLQPELIRHVRADNEQHEPDGRPQTEKRPPQIIPAVGELGARRTHVMTAAVGRPIVLLGAGPLDLAFPSTPLGARYSDAELAEMTTQELGGAGRGGRAGRAGGSGVGSANRRRATNL